jgi:hypothetical protein
MIGRGIGYPTDMSHYVDWADTGASHPLGEAYSRMAPNYPPASVAMFWLLGKARSAFPVLTRPDFRYLFMKVPAIAGDVLTAWFIYLVAGRAVGRTKATWAAAVYLLNPAVISDSTIWGQSDGLVPLFPLIALYALDRGAWWLVGPLCAAALATKFQAVTLIATILAFLLTDAGLVRTVASLAAGVASFVLISLPFVLSPGQFRRMMDLAYVGNLNIFPSVRFAALNFWDVINPAIPEDDYALVTVHGFPITPKLLGLALFAVAWVPLTLAGCARRDVTGRAYAVGMVAWAFFMFPTRIHERYLLPAIAFFSVSAARGAPGAVAVLLAVSAIHLYSCFFRASWATDTILQMMRALLIPTFLAAFWHLRAECLGRNEREPSPDALRPTSLLAGLGQWLTARVWLSTTAVAVSSLCVALAMSGWFHALSGEVSLASLGPYGVPATTSAYDIRPSPDGRGRVLQTRSGSPVRFRFPPAFGAFRTGISLAEPGAEPQAACTATFSVRGGANELWSSGPISVGGDVQWVDVPLTASDTEISLLVQSHGCGSGTVSSWVDPHLIAWRPSTEWGPEQTLFVSDLPEGSRWPLSMLEGTGRWRRDRSAQGNPMTIAGRRVAKGLGVQADSVISFRVPAGSSEFRCDVGLDDEVASLAASGQVEFIVDVDGREVHRTPGLRPGEHAPVQVPVAGARRLTLIVEGASLTGWGHADWGDARFVRGDAS